MLPFLLYWAELLLMAYPPGRRVKRDNVKITCYSKHPELNGIDKPDTPSVLRHLKRSSLPTKGVQLTLRWT